MMNAQTAVTPSPSPWTNAYGLARTVLSFGTLLTLVLNDAKTLFAPMGSTLKATVPVPTYIFNFFFVFGTKMELARWIAVAVLLVVASGWRPRFTGLLHWWITSSFAAACVAVDGGDQVAAVLSLFLVPITLTDSRRWHWAPAPAPAQTDGARAAAMIARSGFLVLQLQVAFVYFQSAVEKFAVVEWRNGTALYYWFSNEALGMPNWLRFTLPALSNHWVITVATWSVLVLEVMLFMAILMPRNWKIAGIVVGTVFHLGIVAVFGLTSFFFSMAAALLVYLHPLGESLVFPALARRLRSTIAGLLRSEPVGAKDAGPWPLTE
jgi:antimicrobial peptide system SdpB family protein